MTAIDKIAEALDDGALTHTGRSLGVMASGRVAEAVVAAIKAMSPSEQAELIGGAVERRTIHSSDRAPYSEQSRVVGPWTENDETRPICTCPLDYTLPCPVHPDAD